MFYKFVDRKAAPNLPENCMRIGLKLRKNSEH